MLGAFVVALLVNLLVPSKKTVYGSFPDEVPSEKTA